MRPEDSSNRRRVLGLGVASSPTQRYRNLIAPSTFVCGGLLAPTTNPSKRTLLVNSSRTSNHDRPMTTGNLHLYFVTVRRPPSVALALRHCPCSFPRGKESVLNGSPVSALLLGSRLYTIWTGRLRPLLIRFRKSVFLLGYAVADSLFTDGVVPGSLVVVRRPYEVSSVFILTGRLAGFACVYKR